MLDRYSLALLACALNGCAVVTVADTAVTVAATTVKVGANAVGVASDSVRVGANAISVASDAVRVGADATRAGVRALTPDNRQ